MSKIAGLVLALALVGCAEQVKVAYKAQSAISQAIAFSSVAAEESRDELKARALYQIEDELRVKCSSVKETGNKKFWGKMLDFLLFFSAWLSSYECEATARGIELRLPELGIDLFPMREN